MSVDIQDVVTCATFCDDRLRGWAWQGVEFPRFPIDLRRRPYNTRTTMRGLCQGGSPVTWMFNVQLHLMRSKEVANWLSQWSFLNLILFCWRDLSQLFSKQKDCNLWTKQTIISVVLVNFIVHEPRDIIEWTREMSLFSSIFIYLTIFVSEW